MSDGVFSMRVHNLRAACLLFCQTQFAYFLQYVGAVSLHANVGIDPTHDAGFVDENAHTRGQLFIVLRGAVKQGKLASCVGNERKG